MSIYRFLFIFIILFIVSCLKNPDGSNIAKPEFDSIQIPDSVTITLSSTFWLQSSGNNKSTLLNENGISYNKERLSKIYDEVNSIFSKAV